MTNDQNKTTGTPEQSSIAQDDNKETPGVFHNPLDPNDDRKITTEDLENEQKFKEALTERD